MVNLRARFLALLCVLAGLLAGCASSSDSAGHVATGGVDRSRTVLQWGVMGLTDVPTLDPALASDPISISVSSMVYGGLVRLDGRLRVQPDGASSWRISRDGKTYTFHLRPDLRFPSGHRVTAADFVAALDRALGPEGSAGTASLYLHLITKTRSISRGDTRTVRGIVALNPSTVRITLTQPAAHFLSELAFPASFVPDLSLPGTYGANWTDHAAGFGPYYVSEWRHSRLMMLRANPYYYGGRPLLRRVVLHFYQQGAGALTAYRRGALDLVSGISPGATIPGHLQGVRTVPGLALDYLAFNTHRAPFNRIGARRAFASVGVPKLTARTMTGTFPARGTIPSAFGVATPGWKAVRTAQSYLARAGYAHGNGFPTVTFVMPRDQQITGVAQALEGAWHDKLGVQVVAHELNSSNYTTVLNARSFDIAFVRWGADYPDPQDFLATQLGASSDNVTGWSSPAYMQAVTLADAYAPGDPRRRALFWRAAELAMVNLPLLPLDEPALTYLARPGLTGVTLTGLDTVVGDWPHAGFID